MTERKLTNQDQRIKDAIDVVSGLDVDAYHDVGCALSISIDKLAMLEDLVFSKRDGFSKLMEMEVEGFSGVSLTIQEVQTMLIQIRKALDYDGSYNPPEHPMFKYIKMVNCKKRPSARGDQVEG